jgi:hypothetical protein
MYIFKYLHQLKNLPKNLHCEVFQKLFEQAKIANMTPEEYDAYNESLKNYRNMNIVVDEYKEAIVVKNKTIAAMKKKNAEKDNVIAVKDNVIAVKDNVIAVKDNIIAEYQRRYGALPGLN